MKKIFILIIVLIFLFFIILSDLIYNGIIWFVYPSKKKYSIRGIDVSHHQGNIDWYKVNNNNLKFVFIKATEGDDFIDENFLDNWNNTKKVGLIRGAYHFYSLRFPGKEQADNFIKIVPNEDNTLPPVIDLEFGGNSKVRPLKENFKKELFDFIYIIENHFNKNPILYTTYNFYNLYIKDDHDLLRYDIWIRNIYFEPGKISNKDWLFWQYNSRGHVEGINGFVDLNVFAHDEEEFKKLIE